MDRSDNISQLTCALAKAQSEFEAVAKVHHNPFLKNHYATLDDIIAAVRGPLSSNGLSFVQPLSSTDTGWVLETIVMHESGEWLGCSSVIPTLADNKGVNALQSFGGSLTYMRRYMLSALLGVNTEEDSDGTEEGENGKGKETKRQAKQPTPAPTQQQPTPTQPARPAQPQAEKPPHWIDDQETRRRFWQWTRETLGLKDGDVHTALGVEHVSDYPGTKEDARVVIQAWVADQVKVQ